MNINQKSTTLIMLAFPHPRNFYYDIEVNTTKSVWPKSEGATS